MPATQVVLIVDDEPMVYQSLRRALQRESFETVQANNADEALKAMAQRPADVVICDEHMPGLRGNLVLARIREQWPATVRMMLTGDSRPETIINAINNGGVERFFLKPVNEVDIVRQVCEALKRRAAKGGLPRPAPLPR
jgi:DNA-binding NtrC family response regulator